MKAFAESDIGKVRENNQDSYYCAKEEDSLNLYIVADGMGGYNGGEVASSLAVAAVKEYFENNFASSQNDRESILALIRSAIEYANMVVIEKAKSEKELEGMGTTLDLCFIYNNKLYIGHVGDSRIYRIRKEFIRKLTKDHSYVQQLVEDGKITKEEAVHHPKKNMITKALGVSSMVEPDVYVKGYLKDDVIVMCTDGLSNMVPDAKLYEIASQQEADKASKMLVEEANKNGRTG